MSRAYETHMTGARMARKLAADYRDEAAETTNNHRRDVCLWEAEQAEERADWYEAHASLFASTPEREAA